MRGTIAAFLVVTWCGACGGDDGGGGGPVPLDELPDAYVGVVCDRVLECSVLGAAIISQISCDSLAYDLRNDFAESIRQGVEDGTIVYDADAMGACLDALATGSCALLGEGLLSDVDACAEAIAGQQTEGDACSDDLQCQRGLYCSLDLACPGTCAPRVTNGGDCTGGATCAAGLACDTNSACNPRPGLGEDCSTEGCVYGLECRNTDDTCVEVPRTAGEGDACVVGEVLCAGDLICTAEQVDAFVCRPRSSLGAACYEGFPNSCPPDSTCSATDPGVEGTCVAMPVAGEPCLTSAIFECAGDFACDDASGNCVARVDNGGACSLDVECANACAVTCQDPVPCP